MIKRPFTVAAITAVIIAVIIVCAFPGALLNENKYTEKKLYELTCKIDRIEEKSSSYYIFASCLGDEILITAAKDSPDILKLKLGSTITAKCSCKEWNRARNHGNFDEKNYYLSCGVFYKFKLIDISYVSSDFSYLKEALRSLRNRLINSIKSSAGNRASMLLAICVGYKNEMDEETKSLFRVSGIAHIFAISGLHISFVGMGIYRLLRKRTGRNIATSVTVFAIICYALMCGFSASTIRALIMLIVKIGALEFGRRYDMLSSASLAIVLLLVDNPFYVMNSGFILSFVAITAVAIIPGIISEFLIKPREKLFKDEREFSIKPELQIIKSAIITGSVISLATLPLIISFNYEFPLYGVFVNTIVLWSLSFILSFSLIGAFLAFLSSTLGSVLINIASFLLSSIELVCVLFTNLPYFNIVTGNIDEGRIVVYYLLLLFFVFLLYKLIASRKHKRIHIAVRLISLLLIETLMVGILLLKPVDNNLRIVFIDVDQGKCILIKSPNGNNYMIDSGSTSVSQVYKYRVESALKYMGISEIDYFLLSHPDTDHISGLLEMLEGDQWTVKVDRILCSDFKDNYNYLGLTDICKSVGIEISELYEGVSIRDGEMILSCLHPSGKVDDKSYNDKSAVLLLEYRGYKALFTGDISAEEEKLLVNDGLLPDIDILDVAHHGSRFSSSEEFIKVCKPEIAVVSAGVNNMYGHPHADTISRLKDQGCTIYNTQSNGEIEFVISISGLESINTKFESE